MLLFIDSSLELSTSRASSLLSISTTLNCLRTRVLSINIATCLAIVESPRIRAILSTLSSIAINIILRLASKRGY